jgi:hypothetical protein
MPRGAHLAHAIQILVRTPRAMGTTGEPVEQGRVGEVEADQGEKGCKTPAATAYMGKTWAREAATQKG